MKEMHCTCIRGAVAFWELWISEIRRTVCFLSPSASSWAHVFGVCHMSASRLRTPCLCHSSVCCCDSVWSKAQVMCYDVTSGLGCFCQVVWSSGLSSVSFLPQWLFHLWPVEMQTGCCRLRSSAWPFEVLNGGPDLGWSSMIQIL